MYGLEKVNFVCEYGENHKRCYKIILKNANAEEKGCTFLAYMNFDVEFGYSANQIGLIYFIRSTSLQ